LELASLLTIAFIVFIGDEKMLEDMWLLARRLEERLESLETILDSELPDWRRKL